MYTTTHVSGPLVHFEKLDRAIQRCVVCGYKLEDLIPSCIAISSITGDNKLPHFDQARLIRVREDNPKQFSDIGDFFEEELPDDFCLQLVER